MRDKQNKTKYIKYEYENINNIYIEQITKLNYESEYSQSHINRRPFSW